MSKPTVVITGTLQHGVPADLSSDVPPDSDYSDTYMHATLTFHLLTTVFQNSNSRYIHMLYSTSLIISREVYLFLAVLVFIRSLKL